MPSTPGFLDPLRPNLLDLPVNPNILIFLPDDLGYEYLYPRSPLPTASQVQCPNLRALYQNGINFQKAYTQPFCSPTRAALLTGRNGFQTGLGGLAEAQQQPLLDSEVMLATALKTATGNTYRTAGFGKWHLSAFTNRCGEYEHPITVGGFDHFEGHLRNLSGVDDYYSFEAFRATPGHERPNVSRFRVDEWSPKWLADRAANWISRQGQNPWLCYFALNLPHEPFHRPPSYAYDTDTYSLPDLTPVTASAYPTYFKAMTQATDWVLGYLQSLIPQNVLASTTIIWWPDNGTAANAIDSTSTNGTDLSAYLGSGYEGHLKRTVYQLGCNTPLVVSGAKVAAKGRTSNSIVSCVDLFRTVIELAGGTYASVPLPAGGTRPSVSFSNDITASTPSARTFAKIDLFSPNAPHDTPYTNSGEVNERRALVYANYKLIYYAGGTVSLPAIGSLPGTANTNVQLYNLATDPFETTNLATSSLAGADATAYNQAISDYASAWSPL